MTTTVTSFEELERLLEAIVDPPSDPQMQRDDWAPLVDAIETTHSGYFRSQAGPDGSPWPALKPMTVAKKGHATILVETGDLQRSLTESGAPHAIRRQTLTELLFGTDRPHADKHQDGRGKLPQREHTGFNEQLISQCVDLVADTVVGKMIEAT